jgi:hypothetical protein
MRLLGLVVRRSVKKENGILNMQFRDKRNDHVLSNANWAVIVDRWLLFKAVGLKSTVQLTKSVKPNPILYM